jgi:hypothetical protein
MRKSLYTLMATLLLTGLLSGCGSKQTADQSLESPSDSLLSSNPSEQTPGNITPQTEYQPQQEAPPANPPATHQTSKPKPKPAPPAPAPAPQNPGVTVPAGTAIKITTDAKISSETANPGDTWTGVVKEPVIIGSMAPIPAGSTVTGVVSGTHPAQKGTRAFLVLAVTSINVGGHTYPVSAGTDSIIAGSTRARNLGAIGGSAAAGALIGRAVGGSGKGALIGGLIGAAAGTGAVAASKGYQVEVKPGTELTFDVNESVTMR